MNFSKIKLAFLNKFKKKDGKRSKLFIALVSILGLCAAAFIGCIIFIIILMQGLPDVGILEKDLAQSTIILDKDGNEIYKLYDKENRTYVASSEISTNMKNAIVAIEDRSFYSHPGVSFIGLSRAFVNNYILRRQLTQGASTLTQQLVKNLVLKDPAKTPTRKIKEAILAFQVERKYTKDKILELYLNQLSLGSTVHGIERGALTFFNKHAKDLSIAESAIIAAVPQAPSYFSPYGQHTDELIGYCKPAGSQGVNVGDAGDKSTPNSNTNKAPVASSDMELTVVAIDRVWLKITSDNGDKQYEGTLEKGEQIDVKATDALTFSSGNKSFEIYQDETKIKFPSDKTFTIKKSDLPALAASSGAQVSSGNSEIYKGLGNCKDINDVNYVKGRKDLVLEKMYEEKYITKEEMDQAWKESHNIVFKPYVERIRYPHFVMYVKEVLEQKFGEDISSKGYVVRTSIDPKVQEMAEAAIKKGGDTAASKYKIQNQAMVAVEPGTGKILAMVGSRDYWDKENDGNVNIITRKRQPGSSFKPFVYALLFQGKYGPGSVLWDLKTKFGGYSPNNYDNQQMGPMKIRNALAYSRNITAVKALILGGGEDALLDFMGKFGFGYLKETRDKTNEGKPDNEKFYYGYPLAIGTGEVRPLDMAAGYASFGNDGVWVEPTAIMEIRDSDNNIVMQWNPDEHKSEVMDSQIAYEISDILSDREARPAGFWRDALNIPGQTVAAKTGTSNKSFNGGKKILPSDLWTVGYSKYVSVAVWSGNNDGSALPPTSDGLNVSAPTWKDFMIKFHAGKDKKDFTRPEGIVSVAVSKLSGLRTSKATPSEYSSKDIFSSWSAPKDFDAAARSIKIDIRNNLRATDECPAAAVKEVSTYNVHSEKPEWKNWEDPVRAWAAGRGIATGGGAYSNEESPLCKKVDEEQAPKISIVSPVNFGTVSVGKVNVKVQVTAPLGVKRVDYMLDGTTQMTREVEPFNVGYVTIPNDTNSHTIRVVLTDQNFNTAEAQSAVKIEGDNKGPVLNVTSPVDGTKVSLGEQLVVNLDAYDEQSRIAKLEVYMNGELIKVFTGEPYTYSIYVNPKFYKAGPQLFSFRALDSNGNSAQRTVNIEFTPQDKPIPPITEDDDSTQ